MEVKDAEKDSTDYVNVGQRFRFCFEVLFLLHIVCILAIIFVMTLTPVIARAIF